MRGSLAYANSFADLFPSLKRRGGRDAKENAAKPPLKGADGVVSSSRLLGRNDHPVCAMIGGFANSSYWRSHPSFSRRGKARPQRIPRCTLLLTNTPRNKWREQYVG